MNFIHHHYLWSLLLILPFVLLFYLKTYKLPKCIIGSNLPSNYIRYIGFTIFLLVFSGIVCALAEPYYELTKYAYKDLRLFFLLDVSKSMAFAEDIPPNRLEAARIEIASAYNNLDGVYQSSLIPFAGASNTFYCPLTTKKNTFLKLLKDADFQVVDVNGTSIQSAIQGLKQIADKYDVSTGKNIVIILSDGGKEDNQSVNMSEISQYINQLKNFVFYTVGIGGSKPAELVSRTDGKFIGYYLDDNKQILKSELDEDVLKQIAKIGKGEYIRFFASGELASQIRKIAGKYQEYDYDKSYIENVSIRHWFYGVSCLMFIGLLLIQVKLK